ncbi:MAG: thioredoxin-dependent thiol peroxidase [Leptospiraceae bacterium]|nr:thioredoxin-dependent thiol peroxidase [Leptospiraceae bacterium]
MNVAEVGTKVKNQTVVMQDGTKKKLKDLLGKKGMVLYFYPRDNTPGCTKEACSFRDHNKDIEKLGYSIVGVSADSVASHQKFIEKQSINFPLISDESAELCGQLGVWGEKSMYGKKFMGIQRATFLLDDSLKIIHSWPKVKVDGHTREVLDAIKGAKS